MGLVLLSGEWRPVREAYALLDVLVEARTYKRDRKGQFSSTGGGGDDGDDDETAAPSVVATKTISGTDDDNDMDLSVIREDDGSTRLHVGIGAQGSTEGRSTSLDREGVVELQEGIITSTTAARGLQQEVKGLQAEADSLDARIDEITQKTMGPPTEHGREYVPLSESDAAERESLTRRWDELDERIGGLEGGDGEVAARGVVRGRDGDLHYASTVRIPAKSTYVSVTLTASGARPEDDYEDTLSFSLRQADTFAATLGEMASQM